MTSFFTGKDKEPAMADLRNALDNTFDVWQDLAAFCMQRYPGARAVWHYAGNKYGWSFRISDKKRVLLYLLPRDGYFKAAFVFGVRAVQDVLNSTVNENIKSELRNARIQREGRGIRIDVRDSRITDDIRILITIKCAN